MIAAISFIIWTIGFSYIFLILRFHFSWMQMTDAKTISDQKMMVSIVVAIRNEALHIISLLSSIQKQTYQNFEIIVIDDHSTDSSCRLVQEFQKTNPDLDLILYQLTESKFGKKEALIKAYSLAKGDIIICTDGDCIVSPEWIQIGISFFENKKVKMVCGGVKLVKTCTFLQHFQAMELMSLIGCGGASICMNQAIMSNGANLSFRKELVENTDEQAFHPNTPSGDDLFLMHECKKQFGEESIVFAKNKAHWVETKVEKSWSDLIQQRLRWVSKSSFYKDRFLQLVSLLVLLVNLLSILLLILSIIDSYWISQSLYFWLLKMGTDFLFLKSIAKDSGQKKLLRYFPVVSLIYPFFIGYTAIAGQFVHFKWKDRNY
jgi:biofilm PGA synthesis N-glycosyltransferase PgaC